MARLIDADALLKWLEECTDEKEWLVSQYNADWIYSMLESAPTVDAVEVVHGRWDEGYRITTCSNCGATFEINLRILQSTRIWEMPNYCPNCGAKMDGGN